MQLSFLVLVWAFLVFVWQLSTVMVPVGVSFSMLMHYNEAQGLLEVKSSAILGLVGSNQLLFFSLCSFLSKLR